MNQQDVVYKMNQNMVRATTKFQNFIMPKTIFIHKTLLQGDCCDLVVSKESWGMGILLKKGLVTHFVFLEYVISWGGDSKCA